MIIAENLTKHFGAKKAVDSVSFNIVRGQVMGLLGPNGAGKSTCMKMISGYLKPTSGRIRLSGQDVWISPKAAKIKLGYLPESAPLYPDLTVNEFLQYIAQLRGMTKREAYMARDRVVEDCFLEKVTKQSTRTLSKGYRHRVCLAQSMIGDPEILIFDEPTDGLDPNQKQEVRNMINRMRPDKCIIVSTHILEEVEAVCSDVLVLNHGRIAHQGNPSSLRAVSPNFGKIILKLNSELSETFTSKIIALKDVHSVEMDTSCAGSTLIIKPKNIQEKDPEALCEEVSQQTKDAGYVISSLTYDKGSISDSFRYLTTNGETSLK